VVAVSVAGVEGIGCTFRIDTVDEFESDDVPFPERLHLNTLGLRFIIDHERSISTWARWALDQTAEWHSTVDPGSWDHRHVFA
jgi:hypothetical protein